jgi:hypothetical protein
LNLKMRDTAGSTKDILYFATNGSITLSLSAHTHINMMML